MLREIPLIGEMSRSDKRVAVFARKRWHGIYAVAEGADVSDTANISIIIKHSITTVGADPCEIPLSGEMSRSDKRVAVRLRTPVRTVQMFTLKNLIGYHIFIARPREHTWVLPYSC